MNLRNQHAPTNPSFVSITGIVNEPAHCLFDLGQERKGKTSAEISGTVNSSFPEIL